MSGVKDSVRFSLCKVQSFPTRELVLWFERLCQATIPLNRVKSQKSQKYNTISRTWGPILTVFRNLVGVTSGFCQSKENEAAEMVAETVWRGRGQAVKKWNIEWGKYFIYLRELLISTPWKQTKAFLLFWSPEKRLKEAFHLVKGLKLNFKCFPGKWAQSNGAAGVGEMLLFRGGGIFTL